jgi:cytosine/adenosine deaminase-related metal-dependent hydrolase
MGEIAPERAIRWLTANAAQSLGIEKQTGTLEAGKMGDVVVWSGNPFSSYALAEKVYIDGHQVYDRSDRSRHAYTVHIIDGAAHYPAENWLRRGPERPLRGFDTADVS